MWTWRSAFWVLGCLLAVGCGDDSDPGLPPIAEGIFAPLGEPLPLASEAQRDLFERGREVALRRFDPDDGLGPQFNLTTCAGCHEKPVTGGGAGHYRDFLLVGQRLPDESFIVTGINGIQSQFDVEPAERHATDADTNHSATRNPIPFFGTGLIAELDEQAILANADPDDEDGDGISGRPNYDRGFVGRLGRKAQTVSVEGFIRGPLFNHLGITSDPLPEELKAELFVPSHSFTEREGQDGGTRNELPEGLAVAHAFQAAAPEEPNTDNDSAPDPELDADSLFELVSFAMLLAAPEPEVLDEEGMRGRALFEQAGCDGCHVEGLVGPRGLIPLYSDLLLHDMGEGLADGIRMGEATGQEFRTQPLWGVSAVGPYLHDGRADTLHEAILQHGGEAKDARDAYDEMDGDAREAVLEFLRSLGGRTQRSAGLLPPDQEAPASDEAGGPLEGLDSEGRARFERGRRLFDRDFGLSAGLGPRFNGDSCRGCHFDPVLGGGGPSDVDVTRQGIIDLELDREAEPNGGFTTPSGGTMAHRHGTDSKRPSIDPDTNFTELRQTPPLFGFGLIDRIPEATILAGADPDDADGDGIAGRAHVLPDGRVGRFGWKGSVPSVAEFVRDASSNEMGISLPEQAGLSFGFTEDDDGVDDPEISRTELEDLIFFVEQLAPLPRKHADRAQEDAGEALFEQVGCAACHTPVLETADGTPVPLYSDLLLHDVQPEGALGIVDGDAAMREFRTSPLWGIAHSAPYMHDGRAYSLEASIERHHAEGAASAEAVSALTSEERAALLAFLRSL